MSVTAHLHELRRKHRLLSDKVEAAQRSPGVDDLEIAELKKQKLRLKEAIHRIEPRAQEPLQSA